MTRLSPFYSLFLNIIIGCTLLPFFPTGLYQNQNLLFQRPLSRMYGKGAVLANGTQVAPVFKICLCAFGRSLS